MIRKIPLVCVILILTTMLIFWRDLHAVTKLALGQARILNKVGTVALEYDGRDYLCCLYRDTCKRVYCDGRLRTNVPCFLIFNRTAKGPFAIRVGDAWLGRVASSKAVRHIFKWIILLEAGENTYDFRDQDKGGCTVLITDTEGDRFFSCVANVSQREFIRMSIPIEYLSLLNTNRE